VKRIEVDGFGGSETETSLCNFNLCGVDNRKHIEGQLWRVRW